MAQDTPRPLPRASCHPGLSLSLRPSSLVRSSIIHSSISTPSRSPYCHFASSSTFILLDFHAFYELPTTFYSPSSIIYTLMCGLWSYISASISSISSCLSSPTCCFTFAPSMSQQTWKYREIPQKSCPPSPYPSFLLLRDLGSSRPLLLLSLISPTPLQYRRPRKPSPFFLPFYKFFTISCPPLAPSLPQSLKDLYSS